MATRYQCRDCGAAVRKLRRWDGPRATFVVVEAFSAEAWEGVFDLGRHKRHNCPARTKVARRRKVFQRRLAI